MIFRSCRDEPHTSMMEVVAHAVSNGRFDDVYGRLDSEDGRCTLVGKRMYIEGLDGDVLVRWLSKETARECFEHWVDQYNRNPGNMTLAEIELHEVLERAWVGMGR
jgi:hypothetical protein